MAVDAAAASANSTATTSATLAGRTRLADNFQTFLTLLTTQLNNQDPMSPLDSNEFTAQLTQSRLAFGKGVHGDGVRPALGVAPFLGEHPHVGPELRILVAPVVASPHCASSRTQ